MSIHIQPFDALGEMKIDWLHARHHFSFASYSDPQRMGIGPLRVWNDDEIQPHSGFEMHGHRDMEIITYVRRGAITHRDNLGNEGRTVAGDVQVMSAGTGIMHSEHNLEAETTKMFQIWIQPDGIDYEPRWDTRRFPTRNGSRELVALASGQPGVHGALMIHQDATLYGATLGAGDTIRHPLEAGRQAYLVPAVGDVEINGHGVPNRAGVTITGEPEIEIKATTATEILLADLP